MSKRKARFMDDGRDELDMEAPEIVGFKSKHSLDSDEEDDSTNKKYDVLANEDVDGQEDATIDFDGDIKITPFNMKEEMEEGHFDVEGNYYFDEASEIKDNWMDNIDWVKVKAVEKTPSNASNSEQDIDYSNMKEEEKIPIYSQMLTLMKPGENVLKSLKRLGGSGNQGSASSRWLKKKKKVSEEKNEDGSTSKENLENLTSFADKLLQAGEYEIYQHTFEKISFTIKSFNEKVEASKTHIPDGTEDDDALDMFADNFDSNVSDEPKSTEDSSSSKAKTDNAQEASEISNEVMWEFKWENKDEEEIHGPHSSDEMQQWVDDGFFPDGVYVRKVSQGPDALFYSSKRIDFELFT